MRRRTRWLLIALAVVIALPLAAVGVLLATIDPNAFKPRIEAAVMQATGRAITLAGPITLDPFGGPALAASDVSFANMPGGSRPTMAHVRRIAARIALLPLLQGRVVLDELTLDHPDLLLETDAAGRHNWTLTPPARQAAQTGGPAAPHRAAFALRALHVTDAAVTLADARTGERLALAIPALSARAASAEAPLDFDMTLRVAGRDVRLAGEVGGLARLTAPPGTPAAAGAGSPVRLTVAAAGAQASIAGTIDDPAHARRYDLTIGATIPDLAALAPFAGGRSLQTVRDIHLAAHVTGAGAAVPVLRSLALQTAAGDLSAYVPGLMLDRLAMANAAETQPLTADIAGQLDGAPFTLKATTGAPAALLPGGPAAPFPIHVEAAAAGMTLSVQGGIDDPRRGAGLRASVDARVADLGVLAPLLHRAVPTLRNIRIRADATDGPHGLAHGVTLTALRLTGPGTDAGGTLTLGWPRPSLGGRITAARINAGEFARAFAEPAKPPPPAAAATPPPVAASAPAHPPAPAAAPAPRHFLIPDRPLPFDRLRAADADLTWTVAELTWPDQTWRNLTGHLVLAGGHASLDPVAADLPEGHLDGLLAIDATKPAPVVVVRLRSPAIALAPLLAALRAPATASGAVTVDANLAGAGLTPHAIAAGATGTLGLSMIGGRVDGGAAQAWLQDVLRRASLPQVAGLVGRTDIQCFALRLDLARGLGTFRALALQTPVLSLGGRGSVNLAEETMALRVEALVTAGIGIALPFDVDGPWQRPAVRPNISAAGAGTIAGGAAGLVIGQLEGKHGLKLGTQFGKALGGGPNCAAELPIARGAAGMPAPPARPGTPAAAPAEAPAAKAPAAKAPAAAPAPAPAPPNPAGPRPGGKPLDKAQRLLRQLLP